MLGSPEFISHACRGQRSISRVIIVESQSDSLEIIDARMAVCPFRPGLPEVVDARAHDEAAEEAAEAG